MEGIFPSPAEAETEEEMFTMPTIDMVATGRNIMRLSVRPAITFPAIEAAGMIPTSAKRLSMLWLRLSPRTKYSPGASVRGEAALPASSMREKPSGVGWGTPLT